MVLGFRGIENTGGFLESLANLDHHIISNPRYHVLRRLIIRPWPDATMHPRTETGAACAISIFF